MKKKYKIWMKIFLIEWVLYFSLGFILPTKYYYDNLTNALLFTIAFVISVILLVNFFLAKITIRKVSKELEFNDAIAKSLKISIYVSIIGLMFASYDKYFIQGIDLSGGIALAREQWKNIGANRDSVSSIYSVMGWAFGSFYFFSTTVLIVFYEKIKSTLAIKYLGIITFLLIANSVITGGRTIIILYVATVITAFMIRRMKGLAFSPNLGEYKFLLKYGILSIVLFYSIMLFSERAKMNSVESDNYLFSFINFLGAKETDMFYKIQEFPEPVSDITNFSTVAGLYLFHSFYSLETVIDSKVRPGRIFLHLTRLTNKLGITNQVQQPYLLPGRFLPLHGAFFYDYGVIGVVLLTVLFSFFISLAIRFIINNSIFSSFVKLGFVNTIFIILFLAPFHSATEFLVFPYTIIGYVGMSFFYKNSGKKL